MVFRKHRFGVLKAAAREGEIRFRDYRCCLRKTGERGYRRCQQPSLCEGLDPQLLSQLQLALALAFAFISLGLAFSEESIAPMKFLDDEVDISYRF
ncbi:hypothetical protein [Paraburkholderia atlantica]|uniref:hypothetical protein n=1 Tax=Paraburkholderia atlantica TaxID=2654982 RepID=UPI00161116E8|nr:hypothetical protein [Paraburkholderia atlantica]